MKKTITPSSQIHTCDLFPTFIYEQIATFRMHHLLVVNITFWPTTFVLYKTTDDKNHNSKTARKGLLICLFLEIILWHIIPNYF